MLTQYLFYFLSFIAIFSALLVVFSKNPVQSVLSLVVTFFAIAGHYVLLNAQFLAAVHVIVYAGAIMVLFLFVIMLLNLNEDSEPQKPGWMKFAATITGGLLMIVMIAALRSVTELPAPEKVDDSIGMIKNLGHVLFTDYALPFEVSSLLFLIAMVGAVMLGKKEIHNP